MSRFEDLCGRVLGHRFAADRETPEWSRCRVCGRMTLFTEPGGGNLLSLEDDAIEVRIALMRMGLAAWSATLNSIPIAQARWERMSKPVPGDYVMEITRQRLTEDYYRGFGILLPPGLSRGEAVIQYGPSPADRCTWTDADFIALPIAGAQWWHPRDF